MEKDPKVLEEAEHARRNLGTFPNNAYRTVKTVAQHLLLNSPFLWNGSLLVVNSRSVGAGVYEMTVCTHEQDLKRRRRRAG